jgi:2'-5' RNA ligase
VTVSKPARLFFALAVPKAVRGALSEVRQSWPESDRSGWRWVEPHLYHLTLAFLGERPPQEIATILEAGRTAVVGHAPFELCCQGLEAFPSARQPERTLWAGLAPSSELKGLASSISQALQARQLWQPDGPFRAHLTLARRRHRGAPPWKNTGQPGNGEAGKSTS